ncbi:hypothetical protein COY16_02785 [Candidatus Roizmanbacteria bacterium CG_4_10_14_0_2_um_filter_39_13]|uniref:FAD-binding FR-type domain-containing protein n=1 Tax=Candidatus Roizmanbacteria bacterium CG_4_10_14_0_2_um_filter_39_13 TaxID=1974825 RepID=A0A2M7TZ28_9BACT|nr:MAG: hypothetical protein COY16_02785 [Candidatus Roizmanbacteria bacterium CG_4_10_14_0_2_um_filter_39_13]
MLITCSAILKSKKEIAPQVFLLQFRYPTDADWSFQAGQYMIFHLPVQEKGHPARRLYSIASAPSQKDTLDFIIEIVPGGLGSSFIQEMNEGDSITMQGPAGMFTFKNSERNIVMLATGTGIAPMYSMLKEILPPLHEQSQQKIHLFWGLKYKQDMYLKKELDDLADAHPNFDYSICLSRESTSPDARCLTGRVTHGLHKLFNEGADSKSHFDYYLCGSPHVIEALKEELQTNDVPKEQIFFEKFN